MAVKFEDMTPVQKKDAFDKWVEGKTARRAKSAIKREATKLLVKKYSDEYDALVKQVEANKARKA